MTAAFPEGLYAGALQGGLSPAFQLLVLENGDSWSLFGTQTGAVFYVAGFAQGTIAFNSGQLSSASIKDFGFTPALEGSLTGSYDSTSKTLSARLMLPGRTIVASGGASLGSLYDYNQVPALSAVSGSWSVTTGQGEGASLAISPSGAIAANSSTGCRFSGLLAPRSSGKNVFNLSATFGPAPCALPGLMVSGIAVSYTLSNGQRQIVLAAMDASRQFGISAFGVR